MEDWTQRWIITGATVLSLNARDEVWDPGFVVVEGEKIREVGRWSEEVGSSLRLRYPTARTVDATGCVVLPGLVNAHTHAAMTIFRGLVDDLPLRRWLEDYIFPAERKLTEEWVYWGTLLACVEMIASGTTSFCDMYLFAHKVAEVVDAVGMRAVIGEVLYDFPSPHYGPIERGFAFTESFITEWKGHERVRISVVPHAVYTCSPDLLRRSAEMAERYDVPLVMHLAETEEERRDCLLRYGNTPVMHLESLGVLSPRFVADHGVWLDEEDRAVLARRGVSVVHNPESNLKLASGIAPVHDLLSRGITVALGTDGCASNNDLDLFSEMDTCAKLQKGVLRDPTVLPAASVLKMATRYGAHTLGFGDRVGQIEPGFLADIIVVDFDKPHLTPCYDPASHLVYAARGADVRDVMVHGRWLLERGSFTTIDLEEVTAHVGAIAKALRRARGG